MRFYAIFFLYLSLAFGQTINVSDINHSNALIPSTEQNISFESLFNFSKDTNQTDENYTNQEDNNLTQKVEKKQNIFISYKEAPTKIFVGQQFSLKVKAVVATQNFDLIKDRVMPQKGIVVLNTDQNWTEQSESIYEKTFYLRASESNATFPQIYFELYKDGNLTSSQKFPNLPLNIIKLHSDKYFSNIIATWLDIPKVKTTRFDDQNLMVVLEIMAKNANLKDFNLSYIKRGGIDSFVDNFPISRMYYYAIVPNRTNKLVFKYFNIKQNRFIKKTVNIVLSDEDISTQSDLNPQDGSFNLYKNIFYGAAAIILFLIFLKRRKIVYLLFFIILIVLFFLGITPLRSIKIVKDAKVYILPTRNSTIFYITPKILEAKKLNTRENYIKIILPNGKIGWIKEKNVIKN